MYVLHAKVSISRFLVCIIIKESHENVYLQERERERVSSMCVCLGVTWVCGVQGVGVFLGCVGVGVCESELRKCVKNEPQ